MDVILVEPEGEENVGYIARAMANFGLKKLVLVSPKCDIGIKAKSRAMHGWHILKHALVVECFDDAIQPYTIVIGTTAKANQRSTIRAYMTPKELASRIQDSNTCIVFGRESTGLRTSELKRCDIVVHIPASHYSTLTISHAAAIIFYELFSAKSKVRRKMDKHEKELLISQFKTIAYSKKLNLRNPGNVVKMFRNVISRSFISGREAHGIAGVFRKVVEIMNK
ncbi:MAG: TrmJ/YjtD family RNA methyltransferase [Candidatus Diapherotrites archaeon]|nr:TrmJ/YjtD family RNA methyltransferase [Candidatus Diapherotrites archaeon]